MPTTCRGKIRLTLKRVVRIRTPPHSPSMSSTEEVIYICIKPVLGIHMYKNVLDICISKKMFSTFFMMSKAPRVEHIPKMTGKIQLIIGPRIILWMLVHCCGAL